MVLRQPRHHWRNLWPVVFGECRGLKNYVLYFIRSKNYKKKVCKSSKIMQMMTHSWFRLVMITLTASIEIGFQVKISKSEVHMTSNLFSLV